MRNRKLLALTLSCLAMIVIILPLAAACSQPSPGPATASTPAAPAPGTTKAPATAPAKPASPAASPVATAAPSPTAAPTAPATAGKTLKVGITTPSTGPAAEKGAPMGHANLDAFEYINKELGGINGYQIEPIWLDSQYDSAKVVTNVRRFMDQGALLFATASSKEGTAAMEVANRAGFPGIVSFTAPNLYRPPQHIYGQMPD
ncbi:MAG: ABC transporter substrate-binding protein, partial [Chloroflexi bacterium]|nr:ABC transporter substrate-binding protein [Chloroflexota bacterium]